MGFLWTGKGARLQGRHAQQAYQGMRTCTMEAYGTLSEGPETLKVGVGRLSFELVPTFGWFFKKEHHPFLGVPTERKDVPSTWPSFLRVHGRPSGDVQAMPAGGCLPRVGHAGHNGKWTSIRRRKKKKKKGCPSKDGWPPGGFNTVCRPTFSETALKWGGLVSVSSSQRRSDSDPHGRRHWIDRTSKWSTTGRRPERSSWGGLPFKALQQNWGMDFPLGMEENEPSPKSCALQKGHRHTPWGQQ